MHSSRVTGLLATNIFLSGAAFAAMTPYRAIVGIESLGLSNATFALVMTLNALGGAFAAVTLGWLSDSVRDRRLLIFLCAVAGAIGFGLIWALRTPIAFITVFCLLVPFGNALFSQSFSYSRAYYDRERPDRAELTISMLRSVFTVAWVIVPPVAGWIAAETSSYSAFAFAALAHVGCTLTVGVLLMQPGARIGRDTVATGASVESLPSARIPWSYKIGIAGVTLGLAALQLNMVLLPLVIVRDLAGSLAQVGINAAVAAAIEVPVMIGWGYLALRMRKESILAIASAIFAVYFGLMTMAASFWQVVVLQSIAAVAIAALLSISISYLQEAIPRRIGLSTSLVDVTRVVASVAAAAVFALNPLATYGPIMAVAAVLSLCGALLMVLAHRESRRMALRNDPLAPPS